MFFSATTLDDLLRWVFERVLVDGTRFPGSRGDIVELRSVLLHLTNPLARISHTETKGKVFSAIGELAWYLSKSNDGDFITYYLPKYGEDLEDDGTLWGAYGPRLFGEEWNNQFENVFRLLKRNPHSKRAVIQLFDSLDLVGNPKEIPCTNSLQFLLRSQRLDMIASMRSNDAFYGLPHDVFSFTMLQEIVARRLECEVGTYSHFVGSLHLYEHQLANAAQYLKEGWQGTLGAAMPKMPPGDPTPILDVFLEAERTIRKGLAPPEAIQSLDSYWQDLIRLLRVLRLYKDGRFDQIEGIRQEMVSRVYEEFIFSKEA